MRRFAGFTVAVILTFASAASALAATSSSTVNESLTVTTSISLTGCPASISFGTADAGTTSSHALACSYSIGGNAATWTLAGTQSDLTGSGGTIAKGNVQWTVGDPTAGYNAQTGTFTVATQADGPSGNLYLQVNIPNGQGGGSYSGTLVLTATGS